MVIRIGVFVKKARQLICKRRLKTGFECVFAKKEGTNLSHIQRISKQRDLKNPKRRVSYRKTKLIACNFRLRKTTYAPKGRLQMHFHPRPSLLREGWKTKSFFSPICQTNDVKQKLHRGGVI
jgi:hypothetical protein